MEPADLYALTGADVHGRTVGRVAVPSGELVLGDALGGSSTLAPFAQPVPSGVHPVELRVKRFAHGDERTLCAVVRFADAAPRTWEPALLAGQDPAELDEDEFFGYAVDGGAAVLCDRRALRALDRLVDAWLDDEESVHPINVAFERHYASTWSWADLDLGDGLNAIGFTTGLGDGVYPAFFGFAPGHAQPVALLTDFLLVP